MAYNVSGTPRIAPSSDVGKPLCVCPRVCRRGRSSQLLLLEFMLISADAVSP